MIVSDRPWQAVSFLREHGAGTEHPETCQTFIGYNKAGQIEAAVAFHHACGRSVLGDIALLEGRCPRHFLRVCLWYAFDSLKVLRLTMIIAESNLKSIAFVEKLGAYRGATLIDGCSDGDAVIYYLLPDQCPLWGKFNGKILGNASGTGPERARKTASD